MSKQEHKGGARKVFDPHEKENQRLIKLFNEASSEELSCGSSKPETSSDSESLSSESERDPYEDFDGDYGSDSNYLPNKDSGSSTTHVSDSEEDRREVNFKKPNAKLSGIQRNRVSSIPVQSPVSISAISSAGEQMSPVDSPITLKDLGVHIRVPASVDSIPVDSPANMENAQMSIQSQDPINLHSFDSDTTPPRSIESQTLLQEIDWVDSENSESFQNIDTTVQMPIPGMVEHREEPTSAPYYQQPSSSFLDVPTRQRPRSPHIIDEEWQTSCGPIPEFEFDDSAVGPQFIIDADTSREELFNRFFPQSIMQLLVDCTNKYGAALCNTNRPHTRHSRQKNFKPTSIEEVKRFLGLCMLQSQVETPNIRKLFTYSDPLYYHPIFTRCMSGRRFEQILRCLCVYEGNAKGINKVLGFANQMIAIFQSLYKPQKQLSLDESMLLFRGRLSFRQYIKSKKAKYGVKFYILTTSDGYILNFKIYQGKTGTSIDIDTETNSKSKTEKLVLSLMQPYLYKGHELYMDNYYNSVALSDKLLSCMTHTTGTLRKDRKDNPKHVVSSKLKKGEHVWTRKGKVYVSAWKDKRIVTMITTQHHPRMVTTWNRYGKQLTKPKEVDMYNKYMSGIDISDQMLSYYSTPKKTVRWYKKVFFHIFDMAIWNAYYTFRQHCNDKATMLEFREHIIRYLIGFEKLNCSDIISFKTPRNPAARMSLSNSSGQSSCQEGASSQELNIHWPELIPKSVNCKRNKAFLKCRLCAKNKLKKVTSYRCKGCTSKPPLCPGCFEQWHCQAN